MNQYNELHPPDEEALALVRQKNLDIVQPAWCMWCGASAESFSNNVEPVVHFRCSTKYRSTRFSGQWQRTDLCRRLSRS